jgi:hypothetical protein
VTRQGCQVMSLYNRQPQKSLLPLCLQMACEELPLYPLHVVITDITEKNMLSYTKRKQNQLRRRNMLETNCSFCFTWCTLLNITSLLDLHTHLVFSLNACCNIHRALVLCLFVLYLSALTTLANLYHFLISTVSFLV